MRPYLRRHHRSWRRRGHTSLWERLADFLAPFVSDLRAMWLMDPAYPLSIKLVITASVWLLLTLPILYFLVPPLSTLAALQVILGPDLCPYDLLGCRAAQWLLGTRLGPFEGHMLYVAMRDLMRHTTFKLSIVVASYEYIQTFRALGLQAR
ncbi:uncharacterized protein [Periplaneta americana]|uniref:uncharacterized protein n=1 Tax=Periplaneta americana TaxID=6978 RepID=UPI0037E7446E